MLGQLALSPAVGEVDLDTSPRPLPLVVRLTWSGVLAVRGLQILMTTKKYKYQY